MNVVRYEPWVLVNRLSRDLERLFNAPYENGDESRSSVVDWVPAVDIKEEDGQFVLTADLPGVDPKDIEVTLEKGVLTLRGRRERVARREGGLPPRRARDRRVLPPLQSAGHGGFAGCQGEAREWRTRDRDPQAAKRSAAQDQRRQPLSGALKDRLL